jgi:hypothetical protein
LSADLTTPRDEPKAWEIKSELTFNGYYIRKSLLGTKYRVKLPNGSVHALKTEPEFIEWGIARLKDIALTGPETVIAASKAASERDPLAGIEGWLILWAIGLIIDAVVGFIGLAYAVSVFPRIEQTSFAGLYLFQIALSGILWIYLIWTTICFFLKKKYTPSLMIVLMLANVALSGLLLLLDLGAHDQFGQIMAVEHGKSLFFGVITSCIWIPYFLKSRRVKATFVK